MKTLRSLIITTVLLLGNYSIFSQNYPPANYKETLSLYTKFENRWESKISGETKKGLFISPVDKAVLFLRILKRTSPDLYYNTECYYKSLLLIVENKPFPRDEDFSMNIIHVLCHLRIESYIQCLERIYEDFKKNKVSDSIFMEAMFPGESLYSNLLVMNYKNPELRTFYNKLSKDSIGIRKITKLAPYYLESIKKTLNGEYFKKFESGKQASFYVYDLSDSQLGK
jgi:hypothetical protein